MDARIMAMNKQGEELSIPTAQMSGSALATLSFSFLDIMEPTKTPTNPVTTVIPPKTKLPAEKEENTGTDLSDTMNTTVHKY